MTMPRNFAKQAVVVEHVACFCINEIAVAGSYVWHHRHQPSEAWLGLVLAKNDERGRGLLRKVNELEVVAGERLHVFMAAHVVEGD